MSVHARPALLVVVAAIAAMAMLLALTPGARAQKAEPPRGEPSTLDDLCRPASDRDPMPEIVVRKVALYYGTLTIAGKATADGVDTTSLIPQALAGAIIAAGPDARIPLELPRRVSPSLDAVTWLETDAPDEDAAANLVRWWGRLLPEDTKITPGLPLERGTLFFKIAEWEASDGGFVPTLTPRCGVAAVTFIVLDADGVLPGDDDLEPDLFPPTPTPRPPIAIFDPPDTNPGGQPAVAATPARTPAGSTPVAVRTVAAAAPDLTPTPRVNDGDVAGVIVGITPPAIPTPRPPDAGRGADQPSGSPLALLAAVALISGSAGLVAVSRRHSS